MKRIAAFVLVLILGLIGAVAAYVGQSKVLAEAIRMPFTR